MRNLLRLLLALALSSQALAAGTPRGHGAVASDHELASQAGVAILQQGGNAIDAAIATALVIGVVNPAGSGLGGGGFLVAWLDGKPHVLDFREVAPAAATRTMFLGPDGKPVPERSVHGGLAVAVPAESIGLAEAHRRWGRLPWRTLVEPARRLAADGFAVGPHLASLVPALLEQLPVRHPLLAWLAPDGKPLAAGRIVKRPALAATLARLAEDPHALQRGPLAEEMARATREAGGLLTARDLGDYKPVERVPVEGRFRGLRVIGVGPPGGGLTAIEALQILDALGPRPADEVLAVHHVIEALNHAFADRPSIADPAFVDVPVARLASPAVARTLAARVRDDGVLPLSAYGDHPPPVAPAPHDHGTSHLCAVDAEGGAVALTTTINLPFGSGVEAAGVILNDEMDDFTAAPGQMNGLGIIGDERNAVAPGKRPQSSMSPTLLLDGRGVAMCVGGSGGPTIVSGTVQVIEHVVDEKMDLATALAAPRLHSQWRPDVVLAEPSVPAPLVDGLRRLGHRVELRHPPTATNAIRRRGDGWEAASDPRKGAKAASY